MKTAALLLGLALLFTGLIVAQTTNYPDQNPPTTQSGPPPAPQNPTNPSTQMPPDSTAPPPNPKSAPPPAGATSPQSNQPELGTRSPEPQTSGPHQVAAGTEIHAVLDTQLSTKTSHVGDQFTATLVDPVRDSRGSIAIPNGTKLHGEVAQAEEGKTLPELRGKGKLALRFRDMTLPNGTSEPLTATLLSVHEAKGGTAGGTNTEGQVESGRSGKTAAKDVGIGAAAGTVGGLVFGSALKGLAIGALAGGGYVAAANGKEVTLPAESGLVLRLDHPMTINASSAP